jgi:hypothetical protein
MSPSKFYDNNQFPISGGSRGGPGGAMAPPKLPTEIFFLCNLFIMLLGTSKNFRLASLATIPSTNKAVLNLPSYDFWLLFWQQSSQIYLLPLKATQLKVVMMLRN